MQKFFDDIEKDSFNPAENSPLKKINQLLEETQGIRKDTVKLLDYRGQLKDLVDLVQGLSTTLQNLYKKPLINEGFNPFSEDTEISVQVISQQKEFAFLHPEAGTQCIQDIQQIQDIEDEESNYSKLLKSLTKSMEEIQKKATEIYKICWHSEQRLLYYLMQEKLQEDSDLAESDVSSMSVDDDHPRQEEETRLLDFFDWETIHIAGNLEPAFVFIHVHSILNFCDMCRYSLTYSIEKILNNTNYKFGGVFGSYNKPYGDTTYQEQEKPWGITFNALQDFKATIMKQEQGDDDEGPNDLKTLFYVKHAIGS